MLEERKRGEPPGARTRGPRLPACPTEASTGHAPGANGLSVELPLARTEGLPRPLADADEIARLGVVLRSEAARSLDPWLKRQRAARAKLGTAAGLAEILSEGEQRRSLSPSQRELVRRAKNLLAGEIALSRGEETETASAWIDEQFALASDAATPSVQR